MASVKIEHFKNGPEKQKKSDVVMQVKSIDRSKILLWSFEEKQSLLETVNYMRSQANTFLDELVKIAKQ